MTYLEQSRIIHRDLAASNVFLVETRKSGELYMIPKIGDFGNATILEPGQNTLTSKIERQFNVGICS
jgi:serine/threonine protein kinase